VSYFSRVVAPDEYHFSAVAEDDDDIQRPEDIIETTDEQLAAWRDIYQIAQRRRTSPDEENDEEADEEEQKRMKDRLLELWMLLNCHMTGRARRNQSRQGLRVPLP
jgi:hypothetical protein